MSQEEAEIFASSPRGRLLMAGESAIAPAALALTALLLCSTFSAAWWARASTRDAWPQAARADGFPGIAAIVAAALTLLWLGYRRLRARLAAALAVHEALAAAAAGETDVSQLFVNSDLGEQARAWNRLVGDIDRIRRQSLADRARQALDRRQETAAERTRICDVLPQGVLVIDEQGSITYANGAAAAFLHCKREDLTGRDFARCVKIEPVSDAYRQLMSGENRRRQVVDVEQNSDDAAVALRFMLRPLRREDLGAALVMIEDITQQRCAEQARHQFVAQATHELRTPLTNIRLYAETAIEDGEANPASRSRCLNIINSETRRLERIVGEMLSVAEIEAGSLKLRREDVRVDTMLADLKADYEPAAAEKKISLALEIPPKLPLLHGDRDKILLALHNLVGNALKYTPEGGRVTIAAESSETTLAICVTDTGIGISDAEVEKIFDRFYRAKDARVAKITGTGIGLTLAREVARLHQGDITVESRFNEGSAFTLTLPL